MNLTQSICIIGAGAIGSNLAQGLARMGFKIQSIIDPDVVREENMTTQGFYQEDIGRNKAIVTANRIVEITGDDAHMPIAAQERLEEGSKAIELVKRAEIVIVTTDNMKSRKFAYEITVPTTLYIDTRMSAESGLIYSFRKGIDESLGGYKNTLYTDEEALAERCTYKSTYFNVNFIIGAVLQALCRRLVLESSKELKDPLGVEVMVIETSYKQRPTIQGMTIEYERGVK